MQEAGRILLMPKGDYAAGTSYEMLDLVNHSGASWVCKKSCTGQTPSDSNTEFWQRFGTAVDMSKYLPLTGGKIGNNTYNPLDIENLSSDEIKIRFSGKSGNLGYLGMTGKGKLVVTSSVDWVDRDILHTGNKPTGTYTGNGDATARTINTGGIGNMCLIYAGSYAVLATPSGAFRLNGDAVLGMLSANCKFVNGVLTIADASAYVNTNGWVYNYQVL